MVRASHPRHHPPRPHRSRVGPRGRIGAHLGWCFPRRLGSKRITAAEVPTAGGRRFTQTVSVPAVPGTRRLETPQDLAAIKSQMVTAAINTQKAVKPMRNLRAERSPLRSRGTSSPRPSATSVASLKGLRPWTLQAARSSSVVRGLNIGPVSIPPFIVVGKATTGSPQTGHAALKGLASAMACYSYPTTGTVSQKCRYGTRRLRGHALSHIRGQNGCGRGE